MSAPLRRTDIPHRPFVMQTYIFHLIRSGKPEPDILSVTVSGDHRARELAGEILGRSPHNLAVEVWFDGASAFALLAEEPKEFCGDASSPLR